MQLEELVKALRDNPGKGVTFELPNGDTVPAHFHVTEVGKMQKDFIDCGGNPRQNVSCTIQVWTADDVEHRLTTTKLYTIICKAAYFLTATMPVEIEYQQDALSMYTLAGLSVTDTDVNLYMLAKNTTCLAPDRCSISPEQFPQPGKKARCCGGSCGC